MNYEKYKGRKLTLVEDGNILNVVVDDCDYDIGITISLESDREKHLICLNGPSAPDFEQYEIAEDEYKKYFDRLLTQIILYKINGNNLENLWDDLTGEQYGAMSECAFT